jgi:hypothetical protein
MNLKDRRKRIKDCAGGREEHLVSTVKERP